MITPREQHLVELLRLLLTGHEHAETRELVQRELDAFVERDPMPAGWNRPAPASTGELVRVLLDAVARVHAGDSYEGTITWVMPTDEPELEGADFGVLARYRIGNLDGQGSLRVFSKGNGNG
jgi:hypothetical protein